MPKTSCGSLLREARISAQLSQSELAGRAGISQSVISIYEADGREPALSTLERLIGATGHRLALTLEQIADAPLGLPDTPRGRRLRQRRAAIISVVAHHGASNVRVFGSVIRATDRPDSDIDLLVDLSPTTSLLDLAAMRRELSELLGDDVDVVPSADLKDHVRVEAERTAITL